MTEDEMQMTINKLEALSRECYAEFCLPPFRDSNNPFFVCDTGYKNHSPEIIQALCKMGLNYKISFEYNKQFIEIILQ